MGARTSDSLVGECYIVPDISLGLNMTLRFRFIDIVRAARQAQCKPCAWRELFRELLKYSQNYLVQLRCSGVPQRRIGGLARRDPRGRVGQLRARVSACTIWNPGYCAYPCVPNIIILPRVPAQLPQLKPGSAGI